MSTYALCQTSTRGSVVNKIGAYLQVGEALANHEIDGDDHMYKKTIGDGAVFSQEEFIDMPAGGSLYKLNEPQCW